MVEGGVRVTLLRPIGTLGMTSCRGFHTLLIGRDSCTRKSAVFVLPRLAFTLSVDGIERPLSRRMHGLMSQKFEAVVEMLANSWQRHH